ncbi:LOW QUALITY PROTEIN: hypothetical protein RJ639_013458, partial [Escallonia herrerae]
MGRLNANASPSNPQPPQEEYQLHYQQQQQQQTENDTFPDDHLPPPPPNDTYYTVEDVQNPPPPPSQQQPQYNQLSPPVVQYPPPSPQAIPLQPVLYPQQSPHIVPPRRYTPASQPGFQQQQAVVQFPPQPVKYPPENFVGQAGYQQPMHNSGNNQGTPVGTPVPSQYPMVNQVGTEGWKTGLFDCMDDPGSVSAMLLGSSPAPFMLRLIDLTLCVPIVHSVRDKWSAIRFDRLPHWPPMPDFMHVPHKAQESLRTCRPGPDWLIHCFCEWCALCQEYRELQHRGLDPSIGYMANVARNQQQQHGEERDSFVYVCL